MLYLNPGIDAICYLEGERVLPNLLEIIERDGKINFCSGIAFRNEANEVIDCPDAPLIESSIPTVTIKEDNDSIPDLVGTEGVEGREKFEEKEEISNE